MPGVDDFKREPIKFVPPMAAVEVASDRSGVILLDQEPDEAEADTRVEALG